MLGKLLCCSFCCCYSCLFIILSSWPDLQYLTTALAMLGKLFATAAFATIYVLSAELFPTAIRNVGMGSSSFWARVGGMISPLIADTVSWTYIPISFPSLHLFFILWSIIVFHGRLGVDYKMFICEEILEEDCIFAIWLNWSRLRKGTFASRVMFINLVKVPCVL